MMNLNFLITTGTQTPGIETFYFPVPVRGIVKSVNATFDTAVAADDTLEVKRAGTAVNAILTGATTAGKVYTGTPDATNKDLVFNPSSDTATYKRLEIVISQLPTKNTVVGITIEYDPSCAITQSPAEA